MCVHTLHVLHVVVSQYLYVRTMLGGLDLQGCSSTPWIMLNYHILATALHQNLPQVIHRLLSPQGCHHL